MDDADAAVGLAEVYLETNNHRRAEEVVRGALASDPHHPRLLIALARARLAQSDPATAASSAHAALAADPENEHAMRVYSRALELQGRLPDALWMAWRAVTTHPRSHLAHLAYARLLESAGRPAEAMAAVTEALRLNPIDADALNVRGDVHLALRRFDLAEADYRHALRIDPEDAEAVHNLARLTYAHGRRWKAIHGFLGAGRLDPSYGDVARQNVGIALTGVLRRSTWPTLIVAFAVIFTLAMHRDGDSTVVPRVVAGLGAVLMLATYTRVMYELPRRTLKSVLRQRQLLAIRIGQVFAGVVLGAQTAIFGAMLAPTMLASVLLLSLPVVAVVGRLTGERLW